MIQLDFSFSQNGRDFSTAKKTIVLLLDSTTLNLYKNNDSLSFLSNWLKTEKEDNLSASSIHLLSLYNDFCDQLLIAFVPEKKTTECFVNLGKQMFSKIYQLGLTGDISIYTDYCKQEKDNLYEFLLGVKLATYTFDRYKSEKTKKSDKNFSVTVSSSDISSVDFADYLILDDAIKLNKDLVNDPANKLYPEVFVSIAKDLEQYGIKVEALDEAEMEKLGMGSLLSVGQGSSKDSKLLVMTWKGKSENKYDLALVGKGVTFDTGGISLKPSKSMEDMKSDMGGGALVTSAIKALAMRKAKVNVVAVVGLVENMPSSSAIKPGDVVTSMSGQTIEILNTDAEGRLVLADALYYTEEKFKPDYMLDFATLTGAIMVALGTVYAGVFTEDDDLAENLLSSSETTGEGLWRMPIGEEYDKMISSNVADVANISQTPWGGSSTAAQFLKRFVKTKSWAHLDIAGVAYARGSKKTASGYGVMLIDDFVRKHIE